jgi:hypothetical protein
VKRSVQATYNTNVNYMSGEILLIEPSNKNAINPFQFIAQMLASLGGKAEMAGELSAADSMAQLEARAAQMAQEEAALAARKKLPAGGCFLNWNFKWNFTKVFTDGRISFIRGESKTTQETTVENPEEIDIDNIEEENGEGAAEQNGGGEGDLVQMEAT